MPTFYDDNFGHWRIETPEDVEDYFAMQRKSIVKKCAGCGHKVKLHPDYVICNRCADKAERGFDY